MERPVGSWPESGAPSGDHEGEKRSSLPRVFTGFAVLGTAAAIADHAVATLVRQAIVSMLWIAYFARSTRVANTFVQRWQPVPPADVGDTMPMPARF